MSITYAQNKKLTLYYPDSTRVLDIAGLDSMSIFICGASKVKYGSKEYNTVLIGSQCWLKENLDIGTMINGSQNSTNNSTIEKYCYGNNVNNCNTYGGLYQWQEAMNYVTTEGTQGICPPGWHIPKIAEFTTLSTNVGGNGNSLKEIGQGTGSGAGTNNSGFSAFLSGYRNPGGYFGEWGMHTHYWSSTRPIDNNSLVHHMFLWYDRSDISFHIGEYTTYGHSVRCIKDQD